MEKNINKFEKNNKKKQQQNLMTVKVQKLKARVALGFEQILNLKKYFYKVLFVGVHLPYLLPGWNYSSFKF